METLVIIQNEKTVTTSKKIAETFGKLHKDVLKKIDNLECSEEFLQRNFAPLEINELHPSPLIKQREYLVTKDGFTFLAMGFTGKRAAKFKEEYINAFNSMEESLKLNFSENKVLSRMELLQLALNAETERLALEKDLESSKETLRITEERLSIADSKATFAEKLMQSTHTMDVGQAAKTLGLPFGRNLLFKKLREAGIFFKTKNEPMQEYISNGCFEVKPYEFQSGMAKIEALKVFVTRKGLKLISDMFGAKKDNNQILLN